MAKTRITKQTSNYLIPEKSTVFPSVFLYNQNQIPFDTLYSCNRMKQLLAKTKPDSSETPELDWLQLTIRARTGWISGFQVNHSKSEAKPLGITLKYWVGSSILHPQLPNLCQPYLCLSSEVNKRPMCALLWLSRFWLDSHSPLKQIIPLLLQLLSLRPNTGLSPEIP